MEAEIQLTKHEMVYLNAVLSDAFEKTRASKPEDNILYSARANLSMMRTAIDILEKIWQQPCMGDDDDKVITTFYESLYSWVDEHERELNNERAMEDI